MEFKDRIRQKKDKEKIVMLTAYDFQMAKILDEAGLDMILVGDSLGMVFQGFKDTRSVTIENMIYHTKAVARGAVNTPIIGDMPVCSDRSVELAVKNSSRLVKAGATGVKIEGHKPEIIQRLLEEHIPVMGHLGLLPQTATVYKVHGKDPKEAQQIFQDALKLDQYGVFSIILECVPESLAQKEAISVLEQTHQESSRNLLKGCPLRELSRRGAHLSLERNGRSWKREEELAKKCVNSLKLCLRMIPHSTLEELLDQCARCLMNWAEKCIPGTLRKTWEIQVCFQLQLD